MCTAAGKGGRRRALSKWTVTELLLLLLLLGALAGACRVDAIFRYFWDGEWSTMTARPPWHQRIKMARKAPLAGLAKPRVQRVLSLLSRPSIPSLTHHTSFDLPSHRPSRASILQSTALSSAPARAPRPPQSALVSPAAPSPPQTSPAPSLSCPRARPHASLLAVLAGYLDPVSTLDWPPAA